MDAVERHTQRPRRAAPRPARRRAARRGRRRTARRRPRATPSSELVEREAAVLGAERRAELVELVLRETVGLGPLEELLADPAVEEVMVNGHERVYVERARADRAGAGGVRRPSARCARRSSGSWRRPGGASTSSRRWPTRAWPTARGSTWSCRRSRSTGPRSRSAGSASSGPGPAELVASGSVAPAAAELLEHAVRERRTILVSGGTGSGKTTLLNALSAWIDPARAGDHDRGRRRAAAAPAARGAAREQAGVGRGQGRGDDPRPAAQRAADAPGPHRDRRGARAPRRSTC